MAFNTKLNLSNAKVYQGDGQSLTLSGDTAIAAVGTLQYVSDPTASIIARSVPDAAWVTGKTATALANYYDKIQINSYSGQTDTRLDTIEADYVTGGTNGLASADVHRLKLGGALTEATIIGTGSQLFGVNAANVNITGGTVGIGGTVKVASVPTTGGVADYILVRSSDGTVKQVAGTSLGAITGATNGLTKAGQNVRLGGELTGNTAICGAGTYDFNIGVGASKMHNICLVGDSVVSIVGDGATTVSGAGSILNFSATQIGVTSGATNFRGMCYTHDYSANYQPLSLVHKGYVDACANATILTANNGLTKVGQNVVLGGTLTGGTVITDGRGTGLKVGIVYGNDYRADLNNCSLIPKQYADACDVANLSIATGFTQTCASNCTITACNGLTKTLQNICFGGAILHDTCVTGAYELGMNMNKVNITGATGGVNLGGALGFKTMIGCGTNNLLCVNTTTGAVGATSLSAFGGLTGATNGISTTGQKVSLGGTLVAPTTINGAFNLTLASTCDTLIKTTGNRVSVDGQSNGSATLKSQSGTEDNPNSFTNAVGIFADFDATSGFAIYDNRATQTGIVYADDYSSEFVDRSLVDKAYVDTVATGLQAKAAVLVATTVTDGNINLATGGLLTIDGVTVSNGDRVLVKNQTDATENGIYIASASTWNRSADFDGAPTGEIENGDLIPVLSGDTWISTQWILTTQDPITVDTDDLDFSLFSQLLQISAGNGINIGTGIPKSISVSIPAAGVGGLEFNGSDLVVANEIAGSGLTYSNGVLTVNASSCGEPIGYEIPVLFNASCQLIVDSDDFSYTTASNGLTKADCNVTLGGSLTGATTITMPASTCLVFTDGRTETDAVGLQYTGNYGANFTARSIPDAQWVTGKTATALANYYDKTQINSYSAATDTRLDTIEADYVTGSTNGISSADSHRLKLGGQLTENTNICGLYSVNFGNTGCRLTGFQVWGSGIVQFGSTGATQLMTSSADGFTNLQSIVVCNNPANGMTIFDNLNSRGIKYNADYSANYVPRSLVDKEYVDDAIIASGASLITASNGLTRVGNDIKLGGTLTGDTTIYNDGKTFTITDASGYNYFAVYDNGTDIYNEDGTNWSEIWSNSSGISFEVSDDNYYTKFDIKSTCIDIFNDSPTFAGLQYTDNYGANFTARSIPDAQWVTGKTSQAILTANNGLTKVGANVILGGSLTGDTTIDGAHSLTFNMSEFRVITPNKIFLGGELMVSGGTELRGTLNVTGGTDLDSELNVVGAIDGNSTLDILGATTLHSTLDVTGATTLHSTLDVTGATTIGGTLTLTSVAAGSVSTDQVMVITSGGEVKKIAADTLGEDNNRYAVDIVTTNVTLPLSGYTILVNSPAAARTITLPTVGVVNGMAYKIKDAGGQALTYNITIVGTIDGDSNATINTDFGALELVYSSILGGWYSMAFVN